MLLLKKLISFCRSIEAKTKYTQGNFCEAMAVTSGGDTTCYSRGSDLVLRGTMDQRFGRLDFSDYLFRCYTELDNRRDCHQCARITDITNEVFA